MTCKNCNGTGKSDNGNKCFLCDGTGGMCDVCGEAVDEPGQDVCTDCEAEV